MPQPVPSVPSGEARIDTIAIDVAPRVDTRDPEIGRRHVAFFSHATPIVGVLDAVSAAVRAKAVARGSMRSRRARLLPRRVPPRACRRRAKLVASRERRQQGAEDQTDDSDDDGDFDESETAVSLTRPCGAKRRPRRRCRRAGLSRTSQGPGSPVPVAEGGPGRGRDAEFCLFDVPDRPGLEVHFLARLEPNVAGVAGQDEANPGPRFPLGPGNPSRVLSPRDTRSPFIQMESGPRSRITSPFTVSRDVTRAGSVRSSESGGARCSWSLRSASRTFRSPGVLNRRPRVCAPASDPSRIAATSGQPLRRSGRRQPLTVRGPTDAG